MTQPKKPATTLPALACRCLLAVLVLSALPASSGSAEKAGSAPPPRGKIEVAQGRAGLPPPVAEMRDAIIAAARSGRLDELLVPIQWNELPPHFGDLSVKATLDAWKKASPMGSGREWLALLINLLEAPYAVVRSGPDIENAKVFIWPAFAELPLDGLTPPLEVELLRLLPAAEAARMKAQQRYDGYALAIGADGTWHAFKKVTPPVRKNPPPPSVKK